VAFKLKKGEISQPFKTQFGYHIVLLEDYEKAYKSTFLEMRSKVEKQYQQQKAYEKMASLSRQLSLKLQKNNSLAQAAGELKLKLQTTSWFNRETGIPQLKSSKELANSLADTYLNDWKGPIPFRENNFFFQIIDSKLGEPDSEKLGKDPSEITERLVASKREEWLKNYLEEQKKELKVKTYSNRI
jgi:hypothetical protein